MENSTKMEKLVNLENLKDLTENELIETDGGIIALMACAFWGGVAYGYAKEKFESGQW